MSMVRFKLQNINMSSMSQINQEPTLFCRTDNTFHLKKSAELELNGPGSYDFLTFFGSLSTCKWAEYTIADNYHVHIELSGDGCSIIPTYVDAFSRQPVEIPDAKLTVSASDSWTAVDYEYPKQNGVVANSFIIVSAGNVRVRNAFYYSILPENSIHDVELALVTTTFRKESYILSNIQLVKHHIIESNELLAKHFHMHVIDNGRTLSDCVESCDGVSIHSNPNVGGAGGFARGMIEAMRQSKKATHVLLMDDDVSISPESILRTFNLLSIVKDEFSEAFISGAMMTLEEPSIKWEDTGFMTFDGLCHQIKPVMSMCSVANIVQNEIFAPADNIPAFSDTKQRYAAWWYCCIPTAVICKKGLPLPIFVRYDDVEYGLRCHPRFMTMNGICVWHSAFQFRYNSAVERYQTTRNGFLAQMISGVALQSDFLLQMHRTLCLELKKYNYDDAELILDGFEDFLKGPDFILQPVAEDCFMRANKNKEKMIPFSDLSAELEQYGIDINTVTPDDVFIDYPRTLAQRIVDYLTVNGQRFNFGYTQQTKHELIDASGGSYQGGKLHRAGVLVAIDVYNKKGAIRKKNSMRYKQIWKRYKRDIRQYRREKTALQSAYSSIKEKITSLEFWLNYLNLD